MADQENIPAQDISVDEDTRTRKTVRLQTIVPAATGPVLDNITKAPEKTTPEEAVPAPAPAAPED